MKKSKSNLIDVSQIQVGMFIELGVGWMAHPFPTGSFKVSSSKQIETIARLGLAQVTYVPEKSDAISPPTSTPSPSSSTLRASEQLVASVTSTKDLRARNLETLLVQQRSLVVCERRFGEALRQYRKTVKQVLLQPKASMEECRAMVRGFVEELFERESAIRLLSEASHEKSSMHPVNVTVISLLLGKALGLKAADMLDLGLAAFLHDIGKVQLPERVRWVDDNFTSAETKAYQEHVYQGVQIAKDMGLSEASVLAISHHHELANGSGFPLRLQGEQLTLLGGIIALVNRYDNLCNPSRPSAAVTPHEALALLFAQWKTRFDPVVLNAFVRMMGVYPPGSVVQLNDERYAIVVSVNTSHPQMPQVVVYNPGIPKHEALIQDIASTPGLNIRRSVKISNLPAPAIDYLAPRQRVAYFFERVVDSTFAEALAA